jgi:hypothetical protein
MRGTELVTNGSNEPSFIEKIMDDPMAFGVISGIIVGTIAAVRGKEIDQFAAYVTAGVGAVGEVALVWSQPDRPDAGVFFAKSAAGMMVGMAPFITWTKGSRPLLKYVAEEFVDAFLVPKPAPVSGVARRRSR